MTYCLIASLLAITALILRASKARAYELEDTRPAVVLAAFGTLRLEALKDLENVEGRVKAAFPEYDVHMAFTCNKIRKIWRQRAAEAPVGGPDPIALKYSKVKNPLSVLADLQETGAGKVLVQSLHVTDGEEYQNLANQIEALSKVEALQPSLRPFQDLRLGPPALGLGDGDPAYLDRAAEALKSWIREASEAEAALVLMGHGNEKLKQAVFNKLEERLRRDYPRIYLGTVEAEPGAEEIAEAVAGHKPPSGRVIMAPLMVVAGDHARKDMAGEEPESWKNVLSAKGLKVEIKLVGLGSLDGWADIYVESLKKLAAG